MENQTREYYTARASGETDHIVKPNADKQLGNGGSINALCGYTIPGVDFFSIIIDAGNDIDKSVCAPCINAYSFATLQALFCRAIHPQSQGRCVLPLTHDGPHLTPVNQTQR